MRSIPALRGAAPTNNAQFDLEADVHVRHGDDNAEQRERAVFDLHHRALELLENLRDVHFDEVEDDRLVRPEQIAGSDAEQE